MASYAMILAVVITIALGQLMFKSVGLRMGDAGFEALLTDHKGAMIFIGSLVLYGVATLGYVLALRSVPLTTAYLFMSLNFILVPVFSHYLFGEDLSLRFWAGSAMIMAGITLAAT